MKNNTLISTLTVIALGATVAFGEQSKLPTDLIPMLTVKDLDIPKLSDEDVARDLAGLPSRFALPTEVSISPASHGLWERYGRNQMRWTYRVSCANALSMNLGFGRYTMPLSGSMTIMSTDGSFKIRPFTAQDNMDHKELWTPIIQSNEVLIEIIVDRSEKRFVSRNVELTSVNAGYRWLGGGEDRGASESCNVDVLCSTGDNWWDEIPSVAVYTLNGFLTCSGVMMNNTAEDQTPYFLTANHCGVTNNSDSSIVVYWNHQNSFCRTGGASGNNGNGNFSQFTTSSTMRATRSFTDFTLIELSSSPNPAWGITFSGWSRSATTFGIGAGIHHPNAAEKRISIPDFSTASGEFWTVNWNIGRTAPGSSGSPLYDANHRVVGQLCCGSSFCSNDFNDFYGRSIGLSWTGGASSSLSPWLDPLGTNPTAIDTLNPAAIPNGACCVGDQGACVDIHETNCLAGGGTYLGDNTMCSGGGCVPACPTDLDGNGSTDVADLLAIISAWGACAGCPEDLNGDNTVDVTDLLIIIAVWGPC